MYLLGLFLQKQDNQFVQITTYTCYLNYLITFIIIR